MNVVDYLTILRRGWLLVVALPLVVALLSLAAGLFQPPRYQANARVIATRGVADPNSTAGVTWAREDTVAQDLPTIIGSPVFARDVWQELQRRGVTLNEGQVAGALHGTSEGKIVSISATADNAENAVAIANAAVSMLQTNGLRYWGDPTWTPETPGVNIGPLDAPTTAQRVPTTREIVLDAALRSSVGLLVALGLVVGLARLGSEHPATNAKGKTQIQSKI